MDIYICKVNHSFCTGGNYLIDRNQIGGICMIYKVYCKEYIKIE